ncbi:DEAD/DEAH box helicase [Marinifilum fragile]|uniref:DEAD/DEAH box helicase n=1 Tax=Marinifilum fragile TaxID=570161 RepID=UPI002AA6177D|nr:DEAD/DEAH box helicase [Marinifilum fragile]
MNKNLTLSTDERTFEQLNHTFTIFGTYEDKAGKTNYSPVCYTTCNINNLHKYIVQTDIPKEKRDMICFHPHYNNSKKNDDSLLPIMTMVDIDVKELKKVEPKKRKNQDRINKQFIKDMNCKNLHEASDKCLQLLIKDKHCVYCDKSASSTGIKALFAISSLIYEDLNPIFESKTQILEAFEMRKKCVTTKNNSLFEELEKKTLEEAKTALNQAKILMEYNSKALSQYLSKYYNINYYENNSKPNYYDVAGGKLSQCTYSSNGTHLHINPNANILFWDFENEQQAKEYENKVDTTHTSVNSTQASKENNEYLEAFFKFYFQLKKDKDSNAQALTKYLKVQQILSVKLVNYTKALAPINSLKCSDIKYQEMFFNEFITKHYKGDSYDLSSFNNFLDSVSNINMDDKYLLSNILRGCYIMPQKDIDTTILPYSHGYDFFGNKYDTILKYKKYVSEEKQKLFDIFNNNNLVVLSAQAGGGKTTLLRDYIKYRFEHGTKRIGFVLPKNALILQNEEEFTNEFKGTGYKIVKNYEEGNRYDSSQYSNDEKLLILTSTPKINYIVDAELLIHDEIQNYVSFSTKIESNINIDCPSIMISATPEKYLISIKNYFYVRLEKYDYNKKSITIQYINHLNTDLDKLIDANRKQFIFYNDKKKGEAIKELYKQKRIDFKLLNSTTYKKDDVKDEIKSQVLKGTHYIGTSLILDGINFNNDKWSDLIIVVQKLDANEIYQLANRFRHVKKLNIIVLVNRRKDDYQQKIGFFHFNDANKHSIELEDIESNIKMLNSFGRPSDMRRYGNPLQGVINNDDGTMTFNKDYLKLQTYDRVFYGKYLRYQDVFLDSLKWYFNIKRIVKNDEEITNKVSIKLKVNNKIHDTFLEYFKPITELFKEIDILSYTKPSDILEMLEIANKIDNSFDSLFDDSCTEKLKLDSNLFRYLCDNVLEFRQCYEQYKTIFELSIRNGRDKKISHTNALKMAVTTDRAYKAQITKLKTEFLGNKKNISDLHVTDKHEYKLQNRMIKIINKLQFTQQVQNGKNLVTVIDYEKLLEFFIRNREQYDHFQNVTNNHVFTLSLDGLKKYCNKISRAFKHSRLRNGKDRTYHTVIL